MIKLSSDIRKKCREQKMPELSREYMIVVKLNDVNIIFSIWKSLFHIFIIIIIIIIIIILYFIFIIIIIIILCYTIILKYYK